MNVSIPPTQYRRIFESAPGVFLLLLPDAGFTIAGVSDEYLRGTLRQRDEIVGRPVFDVFPDNPLTPEANSTRNLGRSLARVLATCAPDVMPIQRYDVPRADGEGFELRYWSPVNAPVLDDDGTLLYILHRVDNVTEYVRQGEENLRQRSVSEQLSAEKQHMEAEIVQRSRELDTLNSSLHEANAALSEYARGAREEAERKNEFLAMLGHELRNPLAALSSALQVWEATGADARRQQELQAICRRQMGNLTRLVDDLLEMSRVDRGEVELQRAPLDLRDVLGSALHAARTLFDRQSVTLATRVAPAPLRLVGDATRLEQVLVNLLGNAAKYSPRGAAVEVRLDPVARAGHAWARIEVADAGSGIPPDKLEAIFGMFVQVDTRIDRARGGLGIGLSLVRALVDLHGGHAWAESAGLGSGSRFIVELPLAPVFEADPPLAPSSPYSLPPAGAAVREVLVIEDNADARETLCALLAASGYAVTSATDGHDGLAQIVRNRPDVAIVDIGLPGLDGFEVARGARQALGPDTPRLVALTGYSSAEVGSAAGEAGFDLHVVKPISLASLAEVLAGKAPQG
ncbi:MULTISPECIES: ATP-binding protein [unclassified Massilia]|uniref:hybrid sensor histidine kinase/response regulator n=1 Tax=unclassified Massilia TaxID=2609279 RepID=UPI00177D0AE9|nr:MULTISPECIES: ATP-binding protein [unclassified Massilia]MBD8532528.1 response regulator [Massilia sp. CFBP 13647]MBD8672982.1 response regulator [Massilia sp. CFBP 13721]